MTALAEQSLMALGLTQLESVIYTFLLQESPATGYRVAKALGKPAANVYKAIESLEAKGAIEVDDGRTKVCRPVPAEVLLEQLQHQFQRHRDQAARTLQELPGPTEDSRVYQIRERDQLFARCRRILATAQQVALLDIFLHPLTELRPDIEQTLARGVAVAIKTYDPAQDVPGAEIILEPEYEHIRRRWPAQWINMVVDGSTMLIALLDEDGSRVIQAVWSGSPFLSWIHHTGISSELAHTSIRREMSADSGYAGIIHAHERFAPYHAPDAPGYHRLLRQLGLSTAASQERDQ